MSVKDRMQMEAAPGTLARVVSSTAGYAYAFGVEEEWVFTHMRLDHGVTLLLLGRPPMHVIHMKGQPLVLALCDGRRILIDERFLEVMNVSC